MAGAPGTLTCECPVFTGPSADPARCAPTKITMSSSRNPTSFASRSTCHPYVENHRSRRLFHTTNTDDRVIVAAAISGFRNPSAASGSASTL